LLNKEKAYEIVGFFISDLIIDIKKQHQMMLCFFVHSKMLIEKPDKEGE
jgi:hypothetical protein